MEFETYWQQCTDGIDTRGRLYDIDTLKALVRNAFVMGRDYSSKRELQRLQTRVDGLSRQLGDQEEKATQQERRANTLQEELDTEKELTARLRNRLAKVDPPVDEWKDASPSPFNGPKSDGVVREWATLEALQEAGRLRSRLSQQGEQIAHLRLQLKGTEERADRLRGLLDQETASTAKLRQQQADMLREVADTEKAAFVSCEFEDYDLLLALRRRLERIAHGGTSPAAEGVPLELASVKEDNRRLKGTIDDLLKEAENTYAACAATHWRSAQEPSGVLSSLYTRLRHIACGGTPPAAEGASSELASAKEDNHRLKATVGAMVREAENTYVMYVMGSGGVVGETRGVLYRLLHRLRKIAA